MKSIIFIIGLTCWCISATCQVKVMGRVKDKEQYLPAVNVVLRQDSAIVKAVVTDSLGSYVLDHVAVGNYQLFVSMVGYRSYTSPYVFDGSQKTILIPEIQLEEESYALSEVVVSGQKQLVDQKIDRTVINVSSSVTGAGNNVLEVLQKSPGVVVNKQSSSISVNGKSGVRIMINEKVMQVPPDVALQLLEGMNASNVERIELITTPGANYDADGSGGIIHIVTKENTDLGTNASATFTLGAHWAETLGTAVNVNHRNKKSAYFLDYSVLRNHNLHSFHMNRSNVSDGYLQTVLDDSHRENVTTLQNLSAGGEWNLGDRTTLNVLFTGYRSNWTLDALATDISDLAPASKIETSTKIKESNVWQSATGSVGIQYDLNTKSRIDFTFDYLFYHNRNPSTYDGNTPNGSIDLTKRTPIHFLVGSVNYKTTKASTFTWDAGLKAVTSTLNNRVAVKRLQGDTWVDDPAFSSNSTLHEQVFAAYLATQWLAPRQWQVNSGVRYEYTHTLITSATSDNQIKRKYGYFFPAISAKKKLANNRELQFTYSRRISRPTYNDIAPYVFFWGPNSFAAGNTALYAALSDAVTAGYQAGALTTSLQYTHTQKAITIMQPELEGEQNSLVLRSQNLKYLNTLAFTNSYAIRFARWWETQATLIGQYQNGETAYLPNDVRFSLYSLNVNLINVIQLPKDFSVEVSWMYQSKSLLGVSRYLQFGSLNAGVQKKFGQHGTLRLAMDDILRKNLWRITTSSPENNLDVYFRYDFHNQFVRLTYTWNLGNTKLRSVKVKSGAEEERNRVGN